MWTRNLLPGQDILCKSQSADTLFDVLYKTQKLYHFYTVPTSFFRFLHHCYIKKGECYINPVSLRLSGKFFTAKQYSSKKILKRQTFQIGNLCLFNTHLISDIYTFIWAAILFPILTPAQEKVRNTKQSPLKTIY